MKRACRFTPLLAEMLPSAISKASRKAFATGLVSTNFIKPQFGFAGADPGEILSGIVEAADRLIAVVDLGSVFNSRSVQRGSGIGSPLFGEQHSANWLVTESQSRGWVGSSSTVPQPRRHLALSPEPPEAPFTRIHEIPAVGA